MFFRKGASKLINYFLTPYLDYKSSHKSRLNRRWPFYTERDQKQKSTVFSYGTVFSSSHWTTKIVNITKSNLDISIKLYPENFITTLYTRVVSIQYFTTNVLFYTRGLYYVLVLYIFSKLVLTPLSVNLVYTADPDLLYDAYFLFENSLLILYYSLGYILLFISSLFISTTTNSSSVVSKINYLSSVNSVTQSTLGVSQFSTESKLTNLNFTAKEVSVNNLNYFLNFFSNNLFTLVGGSQTIQPKPTFYQKVPTTLRKVTLRSYLGIKHGYSLCTKYIQSGSALSLGSGMDLLSSQSRYRSWNPETISLSISKFTTLVKEVMWFVKNFPATSSLHNNTKLFTNSKKLINQPLKNYKGSRHYKVRRYKGSLTFLKENGLTKLLNSKHFSFFEQSRFFVNNRSLLTSTLNSIYPLISPLLKYLPEWTTNILTPASGIDFLLLQEQTIHLNEPYHARLTLKSVVLNDLHQNNSVSHYAQSLTDNNTFSRVDLLFTELLNNTNTSVIDQNHLSTTLMNFTITKSVPHIKESITPIKYYPLTTKL